MYAEYSRNMSATRCISGTSVWRTYPRYISAIYPVGSEATASRIAPGISEPNGCETRR